MTFRLQPPPLFMLALPAQRCLVLRCSGQKLHSIRPANKKKEASDKFSQAKGILDGYSCPTALDTRRALSLDLAGCFLWLSRYEACVAQCREVLAGKNTDTWILADLRGKL